MKCFYSLNWWNGASPYQKSAYIPPINLPKWGEGDLVPPTKIFKRKTLGPGDTHCMLMIYQLQFVTPVWPWHSSKRGLIPLLGIPPKKLSLSPPFNKNFLPGLSSLIYSKGKCLHRSKGGLIPFFFGICLKNLDTLLFSSDYIWSNEYLRCKNELVRRDPTV